MCTQFKLSVKYYIKKESDADDFSLCVTVVNYYGVTPEGALFSLGGFHSTFVFVDVRRHRYFFSAW